MFILIGVSVSALAAGSLEQFILDLPFDVIYISIKIPGIPFPYKEELCS